MPPLITIGVPTYSRFKYLQETVQSALAQTYTPIEVLISDDGSGKEIGPWAQALVQKDPRVRYRRNERNLGLAGNWNAIVDAAQGEWLVLIGDDDRLLPDFATKLAELIQPNVSVIFSNHYLIDEHGQRLEEASRQQTVSYSRDQLPSGRLAQTEHWVWRNVVPVSSALLRTADVRRLRFRDDLNTPEIEYFLRLAREGAGFSFRPDYLMEYRTHPHSATTAGLWGERLAPYLLAMETDAEVEPWKRQFMARLLPGAVTRCLLQGDAARAREFLGSPYYPASGPSSVVRTTQRFCAAVPGGAALYRWLFSLRHKGLATPRPSRVS